MLVDFIQDVRHALQQRRATLVEDLISDGDELTRGQIQGIDVALEEFNDVVANYSEEEEIAA